jgi:hypothetical protein
MNESIIAYANEGELYETITCSLEEAASLVEEWKTDGYFTFNEKKYEYSKIHVYHYQIGFRKHASGEISAKQKRRLTQEV